MINSFDMLMFGLLVLVVAAVAEDNQIVSSGVDSTNPLYKGCFLVDMDAPVCASNGVTYQNSYLLDCIRKTYPNIKPTHYGRCTDNEINKSNCPCPKLFEPVCGTDRQTYDNQCLLACMAKLMMSDIKAAHSGPCQKAN